MRAPRDSDSFSISGDEGHRRSEASDGNVFDLDAERYDIERGAYEEGLPSVDEGLAELRARFSSAPSSDDVPLHPSLEDIDVELTLFTSDTSTSRAAVAQAKRLERALGQRGVLRIVDLASDPSSVEAEREGIRFTPTLVLRTKHHATRFVGLVDDATLARELPFELGGRLATG